MKIIRAKFLGMCFGVRDAIALALQSAQQGPLTVYGELVHNDAVLASLQANGVQMEQQAAAIRTPSVMITAHGASNKTIDHLKARGFAVSEATCPLVHHAHQAVQRLVQAGFYPVIIGKRDHVEVRGLTEDLSEFSIVLTEEDIQQLPERARIGIAAQTTQPIEKVHYFVDVIRKKFPQAEVQFEDTVCQPTKQRQLAAIELSRASDVVVVVGGHKSNNTRELVHTCGLFCSRVYHVESSTEMRPEWFQGARTVGITAGTSTPDLVIDSVEGWLRAFAEESGFKEIRPIPALANTGVQKNEPVDSRKADALAA